MYKFLITILLSLSCLAPTEAAQNSIYPESLAQNCSIFHAKCATCHSASLSLESDYLTPSYWKKTVIDMAARPNANISDSDIPLIYEFLVFDSAVRRKADMQRVMQNMPENKRISEQKLVDQVLSKFKTDK